VSPAARRELIGIGALAAGLFLGLTLLPLPVTGRWGHGAGQLLLKTFGIGAVLFPALGIGWALAAFERLGTLSAGRAAGLVAGLLVLIPYGIGILAAADAGALPANYAAWTAAQRAVGILPAFLAETIRGTVGTAGGALVGLVALSALGLLTIGWHPLVVLRQPPVRPATEPVAPPRSVPSPPDAEGVEAPAANGPNPSRARRRLSRPLPAARPPAPGALIPPIELLSEPSREEIEVDEIEIRDMGQKLTDTLATFRVEGCQVVDRTVGPVVTRYEVAPGPGVKVGRIAALADDLALAIRAQSLRIVAPIPGKAAVGIEVPNRARQMVTLRELLEGEEYHERQRVLPLTLGRNLEGKSVVDDLAKMPHLLIAGATGSGKSVCINTIITSLCYRYAPDELRLLMIDPKMVELSMYNALPHLRHPVVTNNHKAATVLKWAVREMERRYQLFHANHARNIVDFNRKVRDGKPLKGQRETLATQAGLQTEIPFDADYSEGVLPYIVLIVDELADLMMTVQHEVETPLATLAQKARAVGIHLILATQRPSVNVITGLIKANFSCRIAFRVASKVDSRTILDQNGAEALLGNGDMLFLPPGQSDPVRIQGAYVSTEDTERLMQWYDDRAKGRPLAEEDILEYVRAREAKDAEGDGMSEFFGERDALFRQAAEICIQHNQGSTSLLQRRLRIGYGRAARIIDQLHQAGVLGPPDGSKPREVLVGLESVDAICGED
jgi:S-DNA-T family DNA segregation ATPase FtsK/SpoIIIE